MQWTGEVLYFCFLSSQFLQSSLINYLTKVHFKKSTLAIEQSACSKFLQYNEFTL